MNSVFCFDQFELDCRAFELRHGGLILRIDTVVLKVLATLVRNAGQSVSKDQLISEVWNGRAVSDNSLAVAIARLRKVFYDHGLPRGAVVTIHRYGYRFTRRVASSVAKSTGDSAATLSSREIVGRECVMRQLQAAFLDAQHGGGRMVVLRGEAGIGKTRIAETFAEQAVRAGSVVAWGYCREQDTTPPLWPFVELLRSVVDQADGVLTAMESELTSLASDLVGTCKALGGAHEEKDLCSKSQLFDAVAHTLADAARKTPLILILDDLQHADQTSLELVRYLLANISRTHILFVATLRNTFRNVALDSRLSAVIVHRNCVRVAVEPLRPLDVASYLVTRVGHVERALCQRIYELSEGNPFCMVELARQVRDSNRANAVVLTVPKVASELVLHRLRALSEDTYDVLTYAAVLGRAFSLPLLAAVMNRQATEVMATLDSACAAEVVSTAPGSTMEFRFSQGLLHAAIYDAQSPANRRMRHLRVTETLEQRRTLCQVSCAELAFHAHAALPRGDLQKAVLYCTEAASAAEQRNSYTDALRYLEGAREALDLIEDASPQQRFQLLFRHAVLMRAHSTRGFLPLAEPLLRLARELGGAQLAAASLLVDPLAALPRLPLASGVLKVALDTLPNDMPSLRPALMARLASSVPLAYDATASYAQIEQAILLAQRSPERTDRFSAHFDELFLYGGPAHTTRADAVLTTLYRLCNETEAMGPMPLALVDLHVALTALQHGEVAKSKRALDRLELRCGELDCELRWHVGRMRAIMLINLGHTSEGQNALLALHHRARCCDEPSLFCAYDQRLLLSPGRFSQPSCPVLAPDPYDPPNIWSLKLRALEAAGALEDARSALLLVPAERLRELPCDREFLATMGALARTALRLQERAYENVIYECLSPFPECFAVGLSGFCEGSVSLLLGLLAQSMGDARRARGHFELAAALSEQAGLVSCADEARHGRARRVSSA